MMTSRGKKGLKALAVFIAFSFAQVYVQAGLPDPAPGAGVPQRVITARLTTKNNVPITVNGNAVGTGGTILTGATIETPDQVSAVIDLGDAGVVEVEPNTKIQLDFDANGNVRVKVIRGCAVTRKKVNSVGEAEIYTDTVSETTNKKRRNMGFCYVPPNGGLTPMTGIAAGAGGGGSSAGLLYILGGGAAAAAIAAALAGGGSSPSRGTNPSP